MQATSEIKEIFDSVKEIEKLINDELFNKKIIELLEEHTTGNFDINSLDLEKNRIQILSILDNNIFESKLKKLINKRNNIYKINLKKLNEQIEYSKGKNTFVSNAIVDIIEVFKDFLLENSNQFKNYIELFGNLIEESSKNNWVNPYYLVESMKILKSFLIENPNKFESKLNTLSNFINNSEYSSGISHSLIEALYPFIINESKSEFLIENLNIINNILKKVKNRDIGDIENAIIILKNFLGKDLNKIENRLNIIAKQSYSWLLWANFVSLMIVLEPYLIENPNEFEDFMNYLYSLDFNDNEISDCTYQTNTWKKYDAEKIIKSYEKNKR